VLRNRSVPADTVLPHIVYTDLPRALAWLSAVFGFVERYRYGDVEAGQGGAQMRLGAACIMLHGARAGENSPAACGASTQSLTVFVEDVEGHYARAKAAGAKITETPHETIYGEFQYGAEDVEGHHWLFSRHARDVNPEEWGAKRA
jgi:uncharacterized glyoxalase superfamily protein PhnB